MKISWVFDVISPFAYLGLKQLSQLPQSVTIDYVPVLFAALLNQHGQLGPAEIPAKRRFTYRFVLWRARQLGIPMRMPPSHPFNPIAALRLIVACNSERRAVEHVFDAVFARGLDVSDSNIIAQLAADLGIADAPAALGSSDVKQRLRANTDWALAQGVFGVPTIVAGSELFWGQDAFEMARDYLRDPAWFAGPEMQAMDALPVGAKR